MRVEVPKFDEVEAGFEPIPAGRYSVTVTNAEIKNTKDKEGKYINWELTIMGPTNAGRKVWLINSLKHEAAWNLKALLKATGAQFDASGFATENVVGLKCDVTVEQEDYQGQLKNRVQPPYFPSSV